MDTRRFDAIAEYLAGRVSRRSALRGGAAALALASVGQTRGAFAQDGTPAADTALESDTAFLFVQTAAAGTWSEKPNEAGTYLLALAGVSDHTVYFSDRPERIVGTSPTDTFLDGLGFGPGNPPNAAIVAQTPDGEDIAVVELFEPSYDPAAGTLTYEARLLADYAEEGLAHLAQLAAEQGNAELSASFGPASLFIDDCPDADIECDPPDGFGNPQIIQGAPQCFSWNQLQCVPCAQDDSICNDTFPNLCKGVCHACRPVWSLSKGTWDCTYWG